MRNFSTHEIKFCNFNNSECVYPSSTFEPDGLHQIHTCLRDAAPDVWGRRVLEYRYPASALGELDYLLLSGSDRIGALDFHLSASAYAARDSSTISLEELIQAADYVESGHTLPPALDAALLHGTSVGGARPKALITDGDAHHIAKFGSMTIALPWLKPNTSRCASRSLPG